MTASELLKQYILEQALTSDKISEEDKEWVKTFDDLVEWCKYHNKSMFGKYDFITEFLWDRKHVYKNEKHIEYSRLEIEIVYPVKDKLIRIYYPSDECLGTEDLIEDILEGIDNAEFVEPYQELVTYYKAI